MLRNTFRGVMSAASGVLLMFATQPGQAQCTYEADGFASVDILTAPTSTFSYTISAGSVTITPGSQSLTGDGTADGFGDVNTLNNSHPTLPSLLDTVQIDSLADGTTGSSSAKHGTSTIAVASNPVSTFTLKNTSSKSLSLQFIWNYDVYAQASSTRPVHDSASAASAAVLSFSDPKDSLTVLDAVAVAVSGNVPPVSKELDNDVTYTVTVSAGQTDTLQFGIASAGAAKSAPEPGTVAMLVGMGCGIGGLLFRRRR